MPIPFRPIARLLARTMHPAPRVDVSAIGSFLQEFGHGGKGVLITVNHYSAPDFHAWWFVIPISAIFPTEIHWVVTSGWTNSGWLTDFTHWLFPRGASLLGFTPMPPEVTQIESRAVAVRQVLSHARQKPMPVIGMAPQGGDFPGGVLGPLPKGVGRFLHLLSQHCQQVLPVGVWKEDGIINLRFGKPYQLEVPEGLQADVRDHLVGNTVMQHIAELLPEGLRGGYQ